MVSEAGIDLFRSNLPPHQLVRVALQLTSGSAAFPSTISVAGVQSRGRRVGEGVGESWKERRNR